MKKVVLAFDSFKGSASSMEVGESAMSGVKSVFGSAEVVIVPIADGGEGTTQAICQKIPSKKIEMEVSDPLGRKIKASYSITDTGIAVIEMAAASGLPLVEANLRNPELTSTFGTGEMIEDALQRGCRDFIIGIGGSATNDAAMGLLTALGYRFLDKDGRVLRPIGANLINVCSIDDNDVDTRVLESHFTVACDVNNPFYGPLGAAHVYARQKGADDEQIEALDKGLKHFSEIIEKYSGKDISNVPGAGAAGGMGGALAAILKAKLKPGINVVLDTLHFKDTIADADLIITGEGRIDGQTKMGKALNGVLDYASPVGVPVIGIGGSIEDSQELDNAGFTAVFCIQQGVVSLKEAMQKDTTLNNVRATVRQIMLTIKSFDK